MFSFVDHNCKKQQHLFHFRWFFSPKQEESMAELFLSPLVEALVGKLTDSALQQIKLQCGVKEELENLSSTLSTVRAVLKDAEEQQVRSNAVKDWLQKLKDVAYDADDVVDEFATDAIRSKLEGRIQTSKGHKVRTLCLPCITCKSFLFRHKLANKIRVIHVRLDKIAKERHDLHLKQREWREPEIRRQSLISSVVDESKVFGRVDDKEKILELLLSPNESVLLKDICVIAIVGIGGLGKTTLAQLIYNDKRVEDHFEIRAWVCVSKDFDITRLTKAIIESMTKKSCDLKEIDPLQNNLKEILMGKKFLLVLDDVWSEDPSDWTRLQAPLSFGEKGSRIVVTTRSSEVSRIMSTIPAYDLKGLDENNSWSLFTRRAFTVGISDVSQKLEAIGKEIVKKCKGLPLAIESLGGLLHSNTDESKWESILKSEIWESEARKNILPALKLSYDHLPANLKQCFAYCSLFPKDTDFGKALLIQKWIAEGFIQPEGTKRLEDIGSDYFDILTWRSFFRKSQIDSTYKMHDLILDLAHSISSEECFRVDNDIYNNRDVKMGNILTKARYSSLIWEDNFSPQIFETFQESKRLRTFLLIGAPFRPIRQLSSDFFLKLRCLRVLDLGGANVTELPDVIGHLIHLRYIDLSSTNITRLPESMSSLYNLQTLHLNYCKQLVELPKNSSNLINLRHLGLEQCRISMPPGLGKLTNLQTLSTFSVDRKSECGIGQLKDLKELRGGIHILQLENVMNTKESVEANFKEKQHLNELWLEWSYDFSRDGGVDEEVLKGLRPHSSIRKLRIRFYGGVSFPDWMMRVDSLSYFSLTEVRLLGCRNCQQLPPLGQLPYLKSLWIVGIDGLKNIGCEFVGETNGVKKGFPLLEALVVDDMPNLEKWCGVEAYSMPMLDQLKISNCPKLQELPHLISVHDLALDRCGEMVLRSVPRLTTLTSLSITSFEGLISLPEGLLQPLAALKRLEIKYCGELVSWPNKVGLHNLASLEFFKILQCPKLESLADDGEKQGLPIMLKIIWITSCDSLKSIPIQGLRNLTSLKQLTLVTQLPSLPEEALPINLEFLRFLQCHNLKSLPKGMLKSITSLKQLTIWNCPQLELLTCDVGLPTTLTSLGIIRCGNIKSLPEEMISMLTSLTIDNIEILSNGIHKKLTSLRQLIFGCCPQLETLPGELLPTTPTELRIVYCDNLKFLPNGIFNNLTSLEQLTIEACP
ncbi:putative disease resistance protein RGA3 [Tasmannia lanceolata]|uniref:putative disease resistance protein RGA3 n=1 Tax=Tasmannia lanceolata TaxID=3420 RepID=UPI0040636EEE